MQYKVLNDLQIKTTRRTIILKQGQIVELTSDNASKLVGKIEPVEAMPYITDFGSLVIPHNSSQKYHWWNRGQGICDTLREIGRCDLIHKYKSIYSN